MNIQPTSLEAYRAVKGNSIDARHRQMIVDVIRASKEPLSAMQIAAKLKIDYLQVSRRTSEALKASEIYILDRKGLSPSGHSANRYAPVTEQSQVNTIVEQKSLFE